MARIAITATLSIDEQEVELSAVRSQGPGGQNVNKVASAIALRFDIAASSLPARYKQGLLDLKDRRVSREGVLIIKAQRFRTQERNREDAILRLVELVRRAGEREKPRVATKPTHASRARRLEEKKRRGGVKNLRRAPAED